MADEAEGTPSNEQTPSKNLAKPPDQVPKRASDGRAGLDAWVLAGTSGLVALALILYLVWARDPISPPRLAILFLLLAVLADLYYLALRFFTWRRRSTSSRLEIDSVTKAAAGLLAALGGAVAIYAYFVEEADRQELRRPTFDVTCTRVDGRQWLRVRTRGNVEPAKCTLLVWPSFAGVDESVNASLTPDNVKPSGIDVDNCAPDVTWERPLASQLDFASSEYARVRVDHPGVQVKNLTVQVLYAPTKGAKERPTRIYTRPCQEE